MKARLAGLGVLTVVAAVAVVFAGTALAHPHARGRFIDVKVLELSPLNDSGVRGHAILIQRGERLRVIVIARGLEPGQTHPQHIHGLEADANATCPAPDVADDIPGDPAQAADPDQLISLAEGLPAYGPVLVPLTRANDAYPVANRAGIVAYTRGFRVEGDVLDLDDEAIVLHGMTLGGGYVASLPVACGEID